MAKDLVDKIRFVIIPRKLLESNTALFNTYMYIASNSFKNTFKTTITLNKLAEQMGIGIKYVKQNVNDLINQGYIMASEPYIKKNGKKGAITFELYSVAVHYVILPIEIATSKEIPTNFKHYYANLKYETNVNTMIAYYSPNELKKLLRPFGNPLGRSTYYEFINFIKNYKISDIPLLADESTESEYRLILKYEQYVYQVNKNSKIIKDDKQRVKETIAKLGGVDNYKAGVVI